VTGPIDNDAELNWVPPTTPGDYAIRYEADSAEGTFTDDVVVTVVPAPTGPQNIYPASIPSRAAVGEPAIVVEPPAGVEITYPGPNTFPGERTWPGYGPPLEPGIYPGSIPSRAIVGRPRVTVDPVPVELDIYPASIPSRTRVGAPTLTIGAAPPGTPVTDLSISLFAITPYGPVALPSFQGFDLSKLRNSAGAIAFGYPADGENFEVLRGAITAGRSVEVEVWTSGTPTGALRGDVDMAEGDDTAEAEDAVWSFGGRLLGGRMDWAVIPPQDLGPLVPDDDEDPDNDEHANERRELIFNRATPGTVMATAMQIAHDRDRLTTIAWDFTDTHDSEGNAWPQVITSRFSPGMSYTQILDRLAALQLAEWDVVWTGAQRVLKLWVPEARGEDLSVGDEPVVLRHGQNLLDAPRKWSLREAGTSVLVAGADGLYDEASDPAAVARRGYHIDRFVSANNLSDAAAVTAHAIGQLPSITSGLYEVAHGIGFLSGAPRPIATYDLGDWVLSESGDVRERLRVVQWTLSVDENGALSGTVTLNDTWTDALTRLRARLDAVEAGETVVGTSTPPAGSLDDITPPAAPEGLVVSSKAYQEQALSAPLASVTVGWQPVRFNADGSNYPQVQAARHIILKIEDDLANPGTPGDEDYNHIMEDWTWVECPQVVVEHNQELLDAWRADGEPGVNQEWAVQAEWLQGYVDTFSATPTATNDVAGYNVRWASVGTEQVGGLPSSDPFPDAERYYRDVTPQGGVTGTSHTFGDVAAGTHMRIEVRAYDRSGNYGPWATIGHDAAVDDTPPGQPSAPVGAKIWFRTADIPWDGLDIFGVPMRTSAVDFDHAEVWISQGMDFATVPVDRATEAVAFDPTFTGAQHVANLYAAGTWNQPDLAYGVGYFAALRAVDKAGNPSPLSDVVGPLTAEKLFSDDLRDQIINDPNMIAALTIGTGHIVNGAIINAKIANLAVNDANIADLNVGKLRSGTMIAQVTISGKFRTHESDAANRVELDAAGLFLYRGATVVGSWDVETGSMLLTGRFRTGITGERLEADPDGSLYFHSASGNNPSRMSNVGSDVVWRGPLDTAGRSGRVNVNVLGVGLNFSNESEIPNNLRAEIAVFDRRTRITSPYIAFAVDGKLSPTDGSRRRAHFYQTSSSGTIMPYSHVQYGTSSSSGRGGFFGNGAGFKFEAGQMLVTDESLNGFGTLKAQDVIETSSIRAKRDIVDAREALDPLAVIRQARARRFRYRSDRSDAPPRFGVIAEELPEQLQRLSPDGKGGVELSVSLGSQIGLLWAAVNQLLDEREGNA
jgi:hypothetical protein